VEKVEGSRKGFVNIYLGKFVDGKKDMYAKDQVILQRFKQSLAGRVRLSEMILFGSRARGDSDPDSDMDVLVVLDGPVSKQSREIVSDCAWKIGFDAGIVVVPVVVSRENWEQGPEHESLLAKAVKEEGVSI
jgi:uncharacterized protein